MTKSNDTRDTFSADRLTLFSFSEKQIEDFTSDETNIRVMKPTKSKIDHYAVENRVDLPSHKSEAGL